jgi:predicted PurR-regulated permease PerM
MADALRAPQPWLTFTGCVLAMAILYWAQAVIVPIAFATLMAFLLTPLANQLERWIGRVPAVITVAALAFAALGLVGWLVTQQLGSLLVDLPTYQDNIVQKIRDIRGAAGTTAPLDQLQDTVEELQAEIAPEQPRAMRPLVVSPGFAERLWGFPAQIGPLLGSFATAGLVVALVIFMLLEREALRNRLIRLFGYRRLVLITRALDEAGSRVSRYLLMQSIVNVIFGTTAGIGLYLIGVPYPLLWGALAGALRYIPYIGPAVGALAPLLVALALEGWLKPVLVLALFLALELFTNLVLETVIFAGVAGVSQVALLVAVAFWAWLWGPLGILLATPLTVCLAVMGKYVPGLEFVSTLISDEPVLDPDVSYYQRLLAGDQAEAIEIAERHANGEVPAESTYDAIMLPALNYAERDRIEGRLTGEEERAVIEATRELLADAPVRSANDAPHGGAQAGAIRVLGVPAGGEGDAVALRMLADLLEGTSIALELLPGHPLTAEIVETVEREAYRAICIADLPPSPPSKSRNIAKRLRAVAPQLPIAVGRWAPALLADDNDEVLRAAGASYVSASLVETRDYLRGLFPAPEEADPVVRPRKRLFGFGAKRAEEREE